MMKTLTQTAIVLCTLTAGVAIAQSRNEPTQPLPIAQLPNEKEALALNIRQIAQSPEQSQSSTLPIKPIEAVIAEPTAEFQVTPADQNFRKVLARWAQTSGWTFEPEHWTVSRDIPIAGSDSMVTDFKTAVRRLLKSTGLTDLPVQPCFYTNKVLRVIPASELCSRSDN
jgi:Toxin co-regulated pilus biosynthesis protein Q